MSNIINFMQLPSEIIDIIFSNINDKKSILSLILVNKELNNLKNSDFFKTLHCINILQKHYCLKNSIIIHKYGLIYWTSTLLEKLPTNILSHYKNLIQIKNINNVHNTYLYKLFTTNLFIYQQCAARGSKIINITPISIIQNLFAVDFKYKFK